MSLKNEIVELAKGKGLNIAEDAAKDVADLALEVVGKLVAASKNTYDDMIFAAVKGKAEEMLNDLIDKIDGEEG